MPLSLPQAIDLALRQNRSVQLAKLGITDSRQKRDIARAAYLPKIANQSSVLHVTDLAGVEIPAGAFGVHSATGAIPDRSLFLDQGALTSYTSGTGLTQPLSQMFKIHQSVRAASSDVATAAIGERQAEDEIRLRVRQIYFDLLVAGLREQAAQKEVTASELKDQEAQSSVQKGSALEVQALESHADLLESRQSALELRMQIHDLTATLDDLLGLSPETPLQLDEQTRAEPVSLPDRAECLRIAGANNTDVQAAEQAVVKARSGLTAAKEAYIPDVTGLARYSYQSGIPFLVHNFGDFGFTFSWDLYDGGRRESEIRNARTALSEAEVHLAEVKSQTAVQVESQYDAVEQTRSLVAVAEEAFDTRDEIARVTEQQLTRGAALPSASAEANAKRDAAKADSLQAELSLSVAETALEKTIGQMPH